MATETTNGMTPQQQEQVRSLVPRLMQTIHANERRMTSLQQINADLLAICEGRADSATFDRYWPQLTLEAARELEFDADLESPDLE